MIPKVDRKEPATILILPYREEPDEASILENNIHRDIDRYLELVSFVDAVHLFATIAQSINAYLKRLEED